MSKILQEHKFENKIINELIQLNYMIKNSINRICLSEVIDYNVLKEKIILINNVNEEIANKAIFEVKKISGSALEQNIIGFKFLVEGIKIFDSFKNRTITIRLIDYKNINKNIFLAIKQFEIRDEVDKKRIPDIVCFLNGMPIIVCELKSPNASERLEEAYKQNQSLKQHFPSLYVFNIFDFLSNNIDSKYGSITSSFEKYFNAGKWLEKSNPIKRVFNKQQIIDFISIFSFFNNKKDIKFIAAQHQIEAVNLTIEKMKSNKNKGGVVWHTQGSGKSITMLMLSKMIIRYFTSSTILIITDRNSLHNQLFNRFNEAKNYLASKINEIESGQNLIEKLKNKKYFGIFFSTVQKFSDRVGVLSLRNDIFILIDEAHRTQNNIEGQKFLDKINEEFIMKFGFAKFMREAFPNAILTGFTGTPLMGDKKTTNIFGGYNHKYSMKDSVADGSTVPIYYESRKLQIILNKKYLDQMDEFQKIYALTLKKDNIQDEQKMKKLLKSITGKTILEDPDVINAKTKDILSHLNIRKNNLNGKAMIIATSRKAAFNYYRSIINIEPNREKSTILVITHNNKDLIKNEKLIVPKNEINEVANEFRSKNSKFKIAIVVDMWLTGFDVPDLDVMYIDKIMKWHNLMQAIARVNRTYENKQKKKVSGLIVDYLGIWKHLIDAIIQYYGSDSDEVDIIPNDIKRAKIKLIDEMNLMNDNFIPGILNSCNLNSKEQYNFVMKSFQKILELDDQRKSTFILKARLILRLMKIALTIIDIKIATNAKIIMVINCLLSTNNTEDDNELKLTIKKIKNSLQKAVDAKETDIFIKTSKIDKDINEVTQLLETEAEQLKDKYPLVAKKLLEDAINGKLAEIKKYRPVFAKKASKKLIEILSKLEKNERIDKVITNLINFSKDITSKSMEKPEFNDPQLQAFFSILADDEYLKIHKNSEIIKKIAEDLMGSVKENITDQFYINKKVRDKVVFKLIVILKKYNYPPEKFSDISKILVNRIEKTISSNINYYINKKEVI